MEKMFDILGKLSENMAELNSEMMKAAQKAKLDFTDEEKLTLENVLKKGKFKEKVDDLVAAKQEIQDLLKDLK